MRALASSVFVLAGFCLPEAFALFQPQNYTSPKVDLAKLEAKPAPPYMVDNTHNYFHVAPDKGDQNGPVWKYSGSLEGFLENLVRGTVRRGGFQGSNITGLMALGGSVSRVDAALKNATQSKTKRDTTADYWLPSLASLGTQPLAGDGYQFFRDVTAFGADSTGTTDSAEAINAAVSSWSQSSAGGNKTRCGLTCGNTFTQGAIVYFPPGTYKICSPVIQYYYTQFIGDATNPPTIKGCDTFQGIALFDTDPYIPGGSGSEWYVNQNQFFRQIRNFIFDMTEMPLSTQDGDQPLVPTGIHWQVAQATSLQNLVFNMPVSDGSASATTAVGIFMENGSGGFVSDITFNGGNIGWRAGSQQYTARNLEFNQCLTAVQMVWDWGFTWQGIVIDGGSIGFNISGIGGAGQQGTGSISLVDSFISDVNIGILTNNLGTSPNIVLDNTEFDTNVANFVQLPNGGTLMTTNADLWATGARYNGSSGSGQTGNVDAPAKAKDLLDGEGKIFVRSRPQYELHGADNFLVATRDGGCANDGTDDQTICINSFLQKAVIADKIAYFPAGIYRVGSTVFIPTGSMVQGSSWSEIQGAGYYFSDMTNPKVMVQVGNPGDVGKMEIVEMLFSVQGSTAGAILMEWNTAAASQGGAGMWDSHFRVGGALGSDLDLSTCPKFSENDECIAASLLFHVTAQASGYFENIWAWVADHDNDASLYNQPDSTSTQIAVFGARGMLIESQGPTWLLGTSSEHSVLYNYQLSGAKDIYLGHLQTESPYYQPAPGAPAPFNAGASFPNDPDFSYCNATDSEEDDLCHYAWGLRIVDSTNIYVHGAGLYSFFNDFYQDCVGTNNCQERILEVTGSTGVVIFNLFTVAIVEPANGIDDSMLLQSDLQRGFSTEISVWIPLPGADNVDIVYVGPEVFSSPTVSCPSTCLLVFPTSSLSTPSVISIDSYTTSFEYGSMSTITANGAPATVFVTSTTTVTIAIPSLTISGMPFSNVNITSGSSAPLTMFPSVDIPQVTVMLPDGLGSTTPRVVTLPPWPLISLGPGGIGTLFDPATETSSGSIASSTTYLTPIISTITASSAGVSTFTFPAATSPLTISCPAETAITFATPAITVSTTCTGSIITTLSFSCPTTKIITFLDTTTGTVSVDCTMVTAWTLGGASATTTTDPLPIYTTFPPWASITGVTSTPTAATSTNGGVIVPCTAWFFFICISTPNLHIGGWDWSLPPGIYGPGPPPISIIRFPPGYSLHGTIPNWPKITIGNDGQITTDSEPECETQTASICSTTTTFSVTSNDGSPTTTFTTATSTCETITGCSLSVSDYTTSTVVTEGSEILAPIGTWYAESWFGADPGAAFSASVWSDLSAEFASASYTDEGTVITYTTGPTVQPTCASGTACGGHLCTGYYCNPTPTGPPPGFLAPNDPSSTGYMASTTVIGTTSTVPPATSTTTTPTPSATPNPLVYVDIFTEDTCTNVLEQIHLEFGGQCYQNDTFPNPTSFACFSVTTINQDAMDNYELWAWKYGDCFAQDDSDYVVYSDWSAIDYKNELPFSPIGAISLEKRK